MNLYDFCTKHARNKQDEGSQFIPHVLLEYVLTNSYQTYFSQQQPSSTS